MARLMIGDMKYYNIRIRFQIKKVVVQYSTTCAMQAPEICFEKIPKE